MELLQVMLGFRPALSASTGLRLATEAARSHIRFLKANQKVAFLKLEVTSGGFCEPF